MIERVRAATVREFEGVHWTRSLTEGPSGRYEVWRAAEDAGVTVFDYGDAAGAARRGFRGWCILDGGCLVENATTRDEAIALATARVKARAREAVLRAAEALEAASIHAQRVDAFTNVC